MILLVLLIGGGGLWTFLNQTPRETRGSEVPGEAEPEPPAQEAQKLAPVLPSSTASTALVSQPDEIDDTDKSASTPTPARKRHENRPGARKRSTPKDDHLSGAVSTQSTEPTPTAHAPTKAEEPAKSPEPSATWELPEDWR